MSMAAVGGLAVVAVVGFIVWQVIRQRKGGKGKPSGSGRTVEPK
jgi:hypothetical protein